MLNAYLKIKPEYLNKLSGELNHLNETGAISTDDLELFIDFISSVDNGETKFMTMLGKLRSKSKITYNGDGFKLVGDMTYMYDDESMNVVVRVLKCLLAKEIIVVDYYFDWYPDRGYLKDPRGDSYYASIYSSRKKKGKALARSILRGMMDTGLAPSRIVSECKSLNALFASFKAHNPMQFTTGIELDTDLVKWFSDLEESTRTRLLQIASI